MRLEILERPYDLFAVIVISTMLVILILVNEITGLEIQALRVILGLPFILFIPGYVLISALYPEKKKFFDEQGNPISKDEWEELVEKREESEDERNELPDGKGLDNLERVALSLGLSIAITPLIGLVLNYTYDWDPKNLGIRLLPILFSIYGFILVTGVIAIRRRLKEPIEDRYGIIINITILEDQTNMDKILTVGIIIMMVASVSLLVYIIVVPREGEAFTEFYILGPTGMAEKYPRNMIIEETKNLIVGIGNHEHRDMNYTLVISISPEASNMTVASLENVTLSRNRQPSMPVLVEEDNTLEMPCNFSILETGAYKMRFLLYRGDKEYRDLHIWIKVFQDQHLERSEDGSYEVFITDILGDPSGIPGVVGPKEYVGIGIGARNTRDTPLDMEVLIFSGPGRDKVEIDPYSGPINVTGGVIHFFDMDVNSTSSVDVLSLFLSLSRGEHSITISFRVDGKALNTVFDVSVEAG